MNIGYKIQEYREKNRLSQEMLAEKLGVSRQSVSKWELDQSLPEIDKIVAMSKLFKITTDELLIPPPPPPVDLKVFAPEKYEDANKIIEMVQKNTTVIINCEFIEKEIKKQIINKVTGEIDVIGGQISRVSDYTYVVTPKNIYAAPFKQA
jgi:transcriptional regulator with XRE-family HTH domain